MLSEADSILSPMFGVDQRLFGGIDGLDSDTLPPARPQQSFEDSTQSLNAVPFDREPNALAVDLLSGDLASHLIAESAQTGWSGAQVVDRRVPCERWVVGRFPFRGPTTPPPGTWSTGSGWVVDW